MLAVLGSIGRDKPGIFGSILSEKIRKHLQCKDPTKCASEKKLIHPLKPRKGKNCAEKNCPTQCDDPCFDLHYTKDEKNCHKCPTCQRINATSICPLLQCLPPKCSHIDYYAADCCPLTGCDTECQPFDHCPNIVCKRCPFGIIELSRYDEKGCKICPVCADDGLRRVRMRGSEFDFNFIID